MLPTNTNDLLLRRNILDWRDKHMMLINTYFSKELPKLYKSINGNIDSLLQMNYATKVFQKNITLSTERRYKQWVKIHTKILIEKSQKDLSVLITKAQKKQRGQVFDL